MRGSYGVAARNIAFSLIMTLGVVGCGQPRTEPTQAGQLTPDAKLRVAEAAQQGGDGDLAASMYAAAADQVPNDTVLQIRVADALMRAGQIEQARALLSRRVADNASAIDLRRALAMLDVISGQPEPALSLLDAVLARDPRDIGALVAKGVALDLQHRAREAQAAYQRALALAPGDPVVLNDLALSYMLEGRVQEALQVVAPLRDAAGLPDRVKTTLGILYAMAGDRMRSEAFAGGTIAAPALQQTAALMQQRAADGRAVP